MPQLVGGLLVRSVTCSVHGNGAEKHPTRSELMKKRKTNRTAESLGDRIARMSEEDRQDWTDETYMKITDEAVMALHLAGWKIVDQNDPKHLWPFDSAETGSQCPPWCEDLATATATPHQTLCDCF